MYSLSNQAAVAPDAASAERGVVVPHGELSGEALDRLIAAFVMRDGTDYGARELLLEQKMSAVRGQLERGEVLIVFDLTTETANIVPADTVVR